MAFGSRSNVVLIGMPGSGKSTVGVVLAKRLGLQFVDSDLLIQAAEGRPLQAIVDDVGYETLRTIEERVLLELDVQQHVVATGGSAVYSEPAMTHLRSHGRVVHLDVPLPELERRVGDFSQRGLAMRPGQSFAQLFAERQPLYRRYAQTTVAFADRPIEAVCDQIARALDG